MRARVLTRSHPKSSGSSGASDVCPAAKRQRLEEICQHKTDLVSPSTQQPIEEKEFELPQLDLLVQGIDPDLDHPFDFGQSAHTTSGVYISAAYTTAIKTFSGLVSCAEIPGQESSTTVSSSGVSQDAEGPVVSLEANAGLAWSVPHQDLLPPQASESQLRQLQVPRNMLHPSFLHLSQNSAAFQATHSAPLIQPTNSQPVSHDSLSPTAYTSFLDFPELLLHDTPTLPADMPHSFPDEAYQQQQPPAVQWYTADADVHNQHPPTGSYVVIGADGIQMQARTVSSSGIWAVQHQAEQVALPNVIRKISNETITE